MEPGSAGATALEADWRRILRDRLPSYGHRNWIVVADAAYPAQSSPGIETVATGAGQVEVLEEVLDAVAASLHVRPIVYCDRELEYVAEADAPGVDRYRARLAELARHLDCRFPPHEEIISMLDRAGATFRILILKTTLAIPYTSVFVNLDCAYWTAEAERRLRASLAAHPALPSNSR
jgi:L-fucose mutarotase/ribose pyranase (RbsD/FucU family)